MNLMELALVIFLLNIPFGYWRRHAGGRNKQWFLAIHIPVILTILLRFLSGLGWALVTFPVLIAAFFTGQLVGGYIYTRMRGRGIPTSACLVLDVIRLVNG